MYNHLTATTENNDLERGYYYALHRTYCILIFLFINTIPDHTLDEMSGQGFRLTHVQFINMKKKK